MTQLANKKVLITGAASGIGRLMAEKIAELGGVLVLWDIDGDCLLRVCSELQQKGCRTHAYTCDLANKDDIKRCAEAVLSDLGAIDVLINNAGVVAGKALLDNTDDEIELMFNVNVLAMIHIVRAFLPAMLKQQQGHIVSISSAVALCGVPKLVVYSATKSAVAALDESLRLELKRHGHRVKTTVVFPFYISTGMFAGVKSRFPMLLPILKPEKVAGRIVSAILHNRRRVIMPWFVYLAVWAKILPIPIFDALTEFFGISRSMDEFKGRERK